MNKFFYEILDKKRIEILPLLLNFKKDFYLAGGTGLSLIMGIRDSVDFDFFTNKDFDVIYLFKKIKEVFKDKKIKKINEEKNTLTIMIDDEIKISFMKYDYKLIEDVLSCEYFNIASIVDIGCMKCSAILSRFLFKDYVDLYFIIKKIGLKKLISCFEKKFKDTDVSLILKSLVYFDDIIEEKIIFKNNNKIDFNEIKEFLLKEVNKFKL